MSEGHITLTQSVMKFLVLNRLKESNLVPGTWVPRDREEQDPPAIDNNDGTPQGLPANDRSKDVIV